MFLTNSPYSNNSSTYGIVLEIIQTFFIITYLFDVLLYLIDEFIKHLDHVFGLLSDRHGWRNRQSTLMSTVATQAARNK